MLPIQNQPTDIENWTILDQSERKSASDTKPKETAT